VIDDLFEAAMLEENVLVRLELVCGLAELVGDVEDWGFVSPVFDAGVAVGGDADSQIERAGALHGEAQVWRHDDVALHGHKANFEGAAIEGDHQGRGAAGGFAFGEVKSAGGADTDLATASESDVGCVSESFYGGAADEHSASVRDFEGAGDGGVLHADATDGLLRVQRDRCCEEEA
jgi:hypothetical protein